MAAASGFPALNSSCPGPLVSLRASLPLKRPRTRSRSLQLLLLHVRYQGLLPPPKVTCLKVPRVGVLLSLPGPGKKSCSLLVTQMSARDGASEILLSALSLEAHVRCVQGLQAAAKVSSAFPEGSEPVLCRHHLGAEAVHLHPLPRLCMGYRQALVPSPATGNRLLGPNNLPRRVVGGFTLQPLGQAGSASPLGCSLGLAPWWTGTHLRSRGDPGVLRAPLPFTAQPKPADLNMSPQGRIGILTYMSCLVTDALGPN